MDLGPIKSCLCIQIDHNNNIIRLSQAKYISQLLHEYNMSNCKPQPTLLDVNIKLLQQMSPQHKVDRETMAQYPYANLIGVLMYLAHATRSNISYVANMLGQFKSNLGR